MKTALRAFMVSPQGQRVVNWLLPICIGADIVLGLYALMR